MSKRFIEEDYAELNEKEIETDESNVVLIPKRNLLHKLADLADSAGDKMDERRKAKAEKKATKEVLEEEEGEKKRRGTFKKIVIGGLGAAALTGIAALALNRITRDQELVMWVPEEGADDAELDGTLSQESAEEAENTEKQEGVEV